MKVLLGVSLHDDVRKQKDARAMFQYPYHLSMQKVQMNWYLSSTHDALPNFRTKKQITLIHLFLT